MEEESKLQSLAKVFKSKRAQSLERKQNTTSPSTSDESTQSAERLVDSYFEGEEEDFHVNRVEVRSKRYYSSIPVQRFLTDLDPSAPEYEVPLLPTMTQSQNTYVNTAGSDAMGENRTVPTHVLPPPVRIIPSHTSIRQFSGSETDYTARQFLDLCESAMINSSITEDHDKIAFIRSRLMPGSRALNLT